MKLLRTALLPVFAVALALAAAWTSHLPPSTPASSPAQVAREAENGGYRLIDTEQLWQWVQAGPDSILLVDTRQDWEYRTGHIKGAVNFSMEPTWWARWRKGGPGRVARRPTRID